MKIGFLRNALNLELHFHQDRINLLSLGKFSARRERETGIKIDFSNLQITKSVRSHMMFRPELIYIFDDQIRR